MYWDYSSIAGGSGWCDVFDYCQSVFGHCVPSLVAEESI